jgi:hypothetical protein
MPSGVELEPLPSGVELEPLPSGVELEPLPSGVELEPLPSGVELEPLPSGFGPCHERTANEALTSCEPKKPTKFPTKNQLRMHPQVDFSKARVTFAATWTIHELITRPVP